MIHMGVKTLRNLEKRDKRETAAVATVAAAEMQNEKKATAMVMLAEAAKEADVETPQNLDEYARTAAEQVEIMTTKHPVPSAMRVQRWFTS